MAIGTARRIEATRRMQCFGSGITAHAAPKSKHAFVRREMPYEASDRIDLVGDRRLPARVK